eukprot:766756-Hanusia_phi.AAC.3
MMKGFADLEEEHELQTSSDRKYDNSSQWEDVQLDEEGKEDLQEQIANQRTKESEEDIVNEEQ